MKTVFILLLFLLFDYSVVLSQEASINHKHIKEDLDQIIDDIMHNYVYLDDKEIDMDCIRQYYSKRVSDITTKDEIVLLFENLLNEFCDSHLILNTNVSSSYRLYSPIYVSLQNGHPIISSVWHTQINNLGMNIIGAEILKVNGISIDAAINHFPVHCADKTMPRNREWIINKVIAGVYNQPRIVTIKKEGFVSEIDLDQIEIKKSIELITYTVEGDVGIVRINNSLGNNELIAEFDKVIDQLMSTKGLILDLRNTVDGGNSYVARGIMGRFINQPRPYQKHMFVEKYGNNPAIERSWMEYVSPRGKLYDKPMVVIVGRWTGSMGEGVAIGLDAMKRANVVGTEMQRLAGEMNGFSFKHQPYGYRLSFAQLFHVDGLPREEYVPVFYVKQTTNLKDETLHEGLDLIIKNE